MFGGVARLDRDADSPSTEFKVAVAGPLVTAAIVVVLPPSGIAAAGYNDFLDAMKVESDRRRLAACWRWSPGWPRSTPRPRLQPPPAFPMDGGRIARAIAWWQTGDRNSATRFAARLGQGFAYLFIGRGLALIFLGDVFGGIWLALIGFVINGSARGGHDADRDPEPDRAASASAT